MRCIKCGWYRTVRGIKQSTTYGPLTVTTCSSASTYRAAHVLCMAYDPARQLVRSPPPLIGGHPPPSPSPPRMPDLPRSSRLHRSPPRVALCATARGCWVAARAGVGAGVAPAEAPTAVLLSVCWSDAAPLSWLPAQLGGEEGGAAIPVGGVVYTSIVYIGHSNYCNYCN